MTLVALPTPESLRLVAAWHRAEAKRCRPWEREERQRHLAKAQALDAEAAGYGHQRAPKGTRAVEAIS